MNEPLKGRDSDRELLDAFRSGDADAFGRILERYETPLLRFASRYDASTAQDLVQEVFLRLLRERDSTDAIGSLSAWLYRVARNLSIDRSRKEERMIRRHQAVATPERQDPPASGVETEEMVDVVTAKLRELPPRQRDVLILKIQEEKSYREISEITGLSPSNVGYLIHRGLQTLSSELRAAGVV